jgi:hypothetical protein
VWEPWILRLFKPMCTSRVATAHRTRHNRRALTAVAKALLQVQLQPPGGDGVPVGASGTLLACQMSGREEGWGVVGSGGEWWGVVGSGGNGSACTV